MTTDERERPRDRGADLPRPKGGNPGADAGGGKDGAEDRGDSAGREGSAVEVPRIPGRIVRQPVEQISKETVEVPKIKHQEQIGERLAEEVLEVPKIDYLVQITERASARGDQCAQVRGRAADL